MNITLRIPQSIYEDAKSDLERSHAYAAERVGFFSTSLLADENDPVVLVTGYQGVPDEHYIDDFRSGARINSQVIRTCLQRILDDGCGQLHVHVHGHTGLPWPSGMDERELPPLVRSMVVVGGAQAHGGVILSEDGACATLWMPGHKEPQTVKRISIVGFPLQFVK